MTIVFFGNTKYSVIGLKIINATYPVSQVVTIKDSPVAKMASQLNIPLITASQINEQITQKIADLKSDFLIVEDYGLILPPGILRLPRYAALNIHHSLLPKYRGPSPAPAAILAGEKITGVSVIKMSEDVDAGDILNQQSYQLRSDETTESLLTELNELGAKLLLSVIKDYLNNTIKPIHQDNSQATYTYKLSRKDGYFDINNPPTPTQLDRMIRAYYPWPGVWTRFNSKIVKFLPGNLMQMEGKKAVTFDEFLRGYPNFPIGQCLTKK